MSIVRRSALIKFMSFAPAALRNSSHAFFTTSLQQPGPSGAKPFFCEDSQKEAVPVREGQQQQQEATKKCELPHSAKAEHRTFDAKAPTSAKCKAEPPEGNSKAFPSSSNFSKHVLSQAKVAASLVKDVLETPHEKERGCMTVDEAGNRQMYSEHCVLGWSPQDLYRVVADVAEYSSFLPWCLDSIVHDVKQVEAVPNDPQSSGAVSKDTLAMIASLTVGFSFYKEKYTSDVLLVPGNKVRATLHEESMRKAPVLKDLFCEWEFFPVGDNKQSVEVHFRVSFAFRNPLHSRLIMSNIVSLMTKSFEKRCEALYGPPSCQRKHLSN